MLARRTPDPAAPRSEPGIGTQHQVVTIARLAVNDRISMFAKHGSTNANVGMARNLENSPELSMVRIGS